MGLADDVPYGVERLVYLRCPPIQPSQAGLPVGDDGRERSQLPPAWWQSAVTALSAWDAGHWVLGDRHEPTAMRLPLTNDACLKCHAEVTRGTLSGEETSKYHELLNHRGVKTPCFACHVTIPHGSGHMGMLVSVGTPPDGVKPTDASVGAAFGRLLPEAVHLRTRPRGRFHPGDCYRRRPD